MIITVTMNPAVDKTALTTTIIPGGLNRLEDIVIDAGGKGINVSKMIAILGGDSVATGFLGGSAGKDIEAVLKERGIKTDFVNIKCTTRTNLKVLSEEFGITEFNEPGATVTSREMDNLRKKLSDYATPQSIFVFAGSLPQGESSDTYRELISVVKEKGASVFLDADGSAFSLAVLAKPDYIKPNKYELMQYFGKEGECSLQEYAALCLQLIDKGIGMVTLSMGAEGALFVTGQDMLYAPALKVKALSTVGAGDSMVGAIVYAATKKMDIKDTATLAMAASAGAVTTHGTKPPCRKMVNDLVKNVELQKL